MRCKAGYCAHGRVNITPVDTSTSISAERGRWVYQFLHVRRGFFFTTRVILSRPLVQRSMSLITSHLLAQCFGRKFRCNSGGCSHDISFCQRRLCHISPRTEYLALFLPIAALSANPARQKCRGAGQLAHPDRITIR